MLMRALTTFVVLSEIVGGVAVLRLHEVKARGVRHRKSSSHAVSFADLGPWCKSANIRHLMVLLSKLLCMGHANLMCVPTAKILLHSVYESGFNNSMETVT